MNILGMAIGATLLGLEEDSLIGQRARFCIKIERVDSICAGIGPVHDFVVERP